MRVPLLSWLLFVGAVPPAILLLSPWNLAPFLKGAHLFSIAVYSHLFYLALVWPSLQVDSGEIDLPSVTREGSILLLLGLPLITSTALFSPRPLDLVSSLALFFIFLGVTATSAAAVYLIPRPHRPLYPALVMVLSAGLPFLFYLIWQIARTPYPSLYGLSPFGAVYSLFHPPHSLKGFYLLWGALPVVVGIREAWQRFRSLKRPVETK